VVAGRYLASDAELDVTEVSDYLVEDVLDDLHG